MTQMAVRVGKIEQNDVVIRGDYGRLLQVRQSVGKLLFRKQQTSDVVEGAGSLT